VSEPQSASDLKLTTPVVVLLHGWAMHSRAWGDLPAQLADDFRVLPLDLPGHGQNGAPAPKTLEEMADDIAPLLPERAVVVGWSLGAQVALRLALDQNERVAALVLIGATPRFRQTDGWSNGMPATQFDAFAAQFVADPAATIHRFVALASLGSAAPKAVAQQLRKLLSERPRAGVAALEAGLGVLRNTDLRADSVAVAVPAWIIHGEGDAIVPIAAGRWLAETIPGAQFVPVAATGHTPFLTHIDAITRTIREAAFGRRQQP
jgi:pimeloyl-[acyl-carrier protein] methyl ester esterase